MSYDLMAMLPEHYGTPTEFVELQRVLGLMVNAAAGDTDLTLRQLFPTTASGWGLQLWEEAYGIPVDLSRPEEYRRTRIVAKLRGQGVTTVELIRDVAAAFVNGEVEVEEHNDEYYFIVRFVSIYGIPPNIDDLKRAIEEIKPAHLELIFEYKFHQWGDLRPYQWGQMAPYTWQGVLFGDHP